MKNHNSGTDIKCGFSNQIHKLVNPFYGVKHNERWKVKKVELTEKEKAERYDQIVQMDNETSKELSSFFFKRREKKRLAIAREESGYTAKKRAKKASQKAFHSEMTK